MKHVEGTILGAAIGRRSFLKGSAAAVIAAGLGSSLCESQPAVADEKKTGASEDIVKPGTCRGGCGAGCQMNVHVPEKAKRPRRNPRLQQGADPCAARLC